MDGDHQSASRLQSDRELLAARRVRILRALEETRRRREALIEETARVRRRREQVHAERGMITARVQLRRAALLTDDRRARAAILEAAMAVAGMSVDELWLDYFALGGEVKPALLNEMLQGEAPLPRRDHDRLAVALNERLAQSGMGRPVAYWDGTR